MKTIEGLYYAKNHEWLKIEGDQGYVGITDYAQHELGDIVFVDMPQIGDTFDAGDVFGAIESVKAASDIYLPVSGEVVAINEDLDEAPELINEDAFENWIIKIKVTNEEDLELLMNAKQYEEYLKEEA